MSKQVGSFVLVNEEKVLRAVHGSVTREGKMSGGVGENASDEVLLAEYDRLGGLVLKENLKVKTGSFYDFSKKAPRAEPEVTFVTELDGDLVEVTEEEAKAIKVAKEKVAKVKRKAKKIVQDDEEEEVVPVRRRRVSE